jgi:hypothetical protein
MTPDVFLMPALGVVLAAVLPQLFARGIAVLFERVEAEVDVRAAAIGPCLTCVGLLAFWGVRWVGPMAVDRPGAPLGLLVGVTLGFLAGLSAFQAVASLPMPVARAWPPIGAATGVIISALMLVGAVLLWRKTDLLPEDVRPPAYDDDAQALQLLAVERRAQVDPWDPELYLARAWHSVQNGHHERALSDLAIARRVGAGAAPLRALEADTLAAMGRCDDARIAFDAWQQARTADAMATHFGHELEVLPALEDDDEGPSRYLFDCHEQHFYDGE